MVRTFTVLYRLNARMLPNLKSLIEELKMRFNPDKARCAECGTVGHWERHARYRRAPVSYEDGKVVENSIWIDRCRCASCAATHAVIPDALVPLKSYSLLFILIVLRASLLWRWTIARLCHHFGIAVATYYAWKKRYLSHKKLDIGALEPYLAENDENMIDPQSIFSRDWLYLFFERFGFSFLEYSKTTEIRSP